MKVQSDLNNMCNWLSKHELKLNVSKSKVMLLNSEGLCPNIELSMDNQLLKNVITFKFLGVTLDLRLDFSEHYSLLHTKLMKSVFVIKKLSQSLPVSCVRALYFAFYHSNLMYCASVWFPLLKSAQQERLYLLQKCLVRALSKAGYLQHCMPLFKKHCILMVKDQVAIELVKLAQRVINKQCSLAIQNLFSNYQNSYNTRNCNIAVPKHSSSIVNKTFLCKSVNEWMKLDSETKKVTNVKTFAKRHKRIILERY